MILFHPMDWLILVAFAISIWAQFRVKGTFNRWAEVPTAYGLTGYQAARRMLDNNGLHDV
ncbi:zinc metallopeptidase, partial [Paenibacillus darwinianus]